MALLNFRREADLPGKDVTTAFLQGFSIEVMPRTAAGIEDFRPLLPAGTRVYVAHIEGTPIEDMVATAKRLRNEGYEPMPHVPARLIRDAAQLRDWVARYRGEAGVSQALLLAGGLRQPLGSLSSTLDLLDSGAFDGFERLHFAGHPEGNRDIDPEGGDRNVLQALRLKQQFADSTDADVALVTQFAFSAAPVIAWVDRLAAEGIRIPVHIGVAGPAKLQTLLKFAIACGVGPSLKVLQKRAKDVTKLLLPFEPTELVADLAAHKAANPAFGIEAVHFFPLGGIKTNATWVADHTKG